MDGQLDSTGAPASPVKTSVKVIVLVLGILGAILMCCGLVVGVFYMVIPAEMVPAGTKVTDLRVGGLIISGAIVVPGIVLAIVAVCLWFFLWRKR